MAISAIIVAAGTSRRMGFDKLAAEIDGLSVLCRSMLAMEQCPEVSEIRVVTSPEKIDSVVEEARRAGISKLVDAIPGGAERYLSVNAGLERVGAGCELVAVHDAARPLVSPEAISRCGAVAKETGAASLAHRVVDTLKRVTADGDVADSVSREDLWAMETPQIFSVELLRRAYAAVMSEGKLVTDEVSAIEAIGEKVRLVENPEPNVKITVPSDLRLAEAILASAD